MPDTDDTAARPPELPWELLRQFLAIAEAGSLSKAAARLGVSQPTLTRQLAAMESTLGLALFERTTRGVTLSEAARAMLEPVREMHRQAHAVERIAQGLDAAPGGLVRISASEMVAMWLLPPMLARMRGALPDVDVRVLATDRVANLVEREADIALRMVRPEQPQLIARRVADLPLGLYAHPDYLARLGSPRTLADLLAHDIVGVDDGAALRQGLAAQGVDADRLRIVAGSNSRAVSWELVRAGLGIGFGMTAIGEASAPLVRLLPQAPLPRLPLWMTGHQEVGASRAARARLDATRRDADG